MRLQVITSNSTHYWSVTNAAPAKPYLQISNQYLPLTTATRAGIKLKIESGTKTYRACVYESNTYKTSSTAKGNMSSTTALTTTSGVTKATTGLINIMSNSRINSTIGKSNYFTQVTAYIYTGNASYSITRVISKDYTIIPINTDYGYMQMRPDPNNAINVLATSIRFTTEGTYGIYCRSKNNYSSRMLSEYVSCKNGYTYSTTTSTSQVQYESGGFTTASLDFAASNSTYPFYSKFYTCLNSHTQTWARIGTTSSATSDALYCQTNVGGYARSTIIWNSSTSTLYTVIGESKSSAVTWASETWQTSYIRVKSTSNAGWDHNQKFSYSWQWYAHGQFVDFFTTGNVTRTNTQTVTTAYSGVSSSSGWK